MSMKKSTIVIEEVDRVDFRTRLDEVLSRFDDDRIFNIDTGMVHDKYDFRGRPLTYYYAIIIVKGEAFEI